MQAKKIFIPRAAGFCRDCGLNQWNQATDRNGTEQYGGAGSYELLQYKIIKLAALVGDTSPAKLVPP